MTNNEIAISLNMSKQLVSYYHRTALKKLKSNDKGIGDDYIGKEN
ncbi:hypothetical protein [Bacillus velezensis]